MLFDSILYDDLFKVVMTAFDQLQTPELNQQVAMFNNNPEKHSEALEQIREMVFDI